MADPANRCGTYDGVNDHNRKGEMVCDDCLLAAANYQHFRRRRMAFGLPATGEEPWLNISETAAPVVLRRALLESA